MSENELRESAQRVQDWLAERGFSCQVLEMPASTRTSEEAAKAAGCTVAQIAKSLVMIGKKSGTFYLVIASGPNRVDLKMVSKLLGEPVKMAPAEAVKEATGFAIGGIPPAGHLIPLTTVIDADLMELEEIWAAAGTPHAVFKLTPKLLVEITGGQVAPVC